MAGARETVASNTPHGAVALPKRQHRHDAESSSAPVWSLESTAGNGNGNAEVPLGEWFPRLFPSRCGESSGPLTTRCGDQKNPLSSKPLSWDAYTIRLCAAAKCDLHNRERTVCCRDLKGDDERHLVDPDIVRDIIMCVRESRGSPDASRWWLT